MTGLPVSYASRTLTCAENKYTEIEKEFLTICYALEKFHYFVYGRKVVVQTDHKSLLSIYKKNMDKVPARLQRFLIRSLKYNVELRFVPGKEILLIADCLSRAPCDIHETDDPELPYIVHTIS